MSQACASTDNPTPAALAGIRVIDMSRVLAGPWCSQILADFGAEVIKIERPGSGDDSRGWEPSFPTELSGMPTSAYFCAANRGKKSMTVNFADPEGAGLIRRLVEHADVFIENYKADDLARRGLGYEALKEINPRLVYCSITGFGQTGPYRARAGYDTIIQAMGGLMSLTGERDDRPGGGPQRSGLPGIDLMSGVYSALAILAALRHRDATGCGQWIDLSLLDVQVSNLAFFGVDYLATGKVQQRMGNLNPVTHPSGVYACADADIVVLIGNDEQFSRFCRLLALPELIHDGRFATSGDRVRNAASLDALIAPVLRTAAASAWTLTLEAAGIPCGSINDIAGVFADPQVVARGSAKTVRHPSLGAIPIVANPIRMSATPAQYDAPPPLLGEHTLEILASVLGMTPGDVEALGRRGIV